jgi:hypothetical protein
LAYICLQKDALVVCLFPLFIFIVIIFKYYFLDNILFAWAGTTINQVGSPTYYRVQGPTFIIEYDNTQNNANHIHSVIRDLKNDFGGDALLNHYKQDHANK